MVDKKEIAEEARVIESLMPLCIVCESEYCRLNPRGVCLAPLLTGKTPAWDTPDGCLDFVCQDD